MASENTIYFYPGQGGHSHDGENSSFIDTSKYSLFDFSWGLLGDPSRVASQTMNYNSFQNFIVETVNNAVLKPAGLILQPGTVNGDSDIISNSISTKLIAADAITVNEIAANTITSNELTANFVLVNTIIASSDFNGTFDPNTFVFSNTGTDGWAISSSGDAVFTNGLFRGNLFVGANDYWYSNGDFALGGNTGIYRNAGGGITLGGDVTILGGVVASSVVTPGLTIDSNGDLTSGGGATVLFADGSIATSSGNFTVDSSGNLSAENAQIRGEISSDTFVTHTNFGGSGSWTRPTVLIDNANNRLEVNSAAGGLRITADSIQRYSSGNSFYSINWDFNAGWYNFLGIITVDEIGTDTLGVRLINASGSISVDASQMVSVGSSYLSSGHIYSTNTIQADGAMSAPYFIMSGTVAGTGSSLIRRSDGYILIASSKRELKTNIGDISDSLVKIAALRPRVFNWKPQLGDPDDIFHREIKTNHKTMGFVVEEVAETSPEYLEYRIAEDGTLDGHYWKPHDFIALAMQGIKDLSAKVTSLEQRIAQLEG